jgi:hypothetical protein
MTVGIIHASRLNGVVSQLLNSRSSDGERQRNHRECNESHPASHVIARLIAGQIMSKYIISDTLQLILLVGLLALAPLAHGQEAKTLLQIQRLRAELETETNSMSIGRNAYDEGSKGEQQLDVRRYPNSAACLLVYDNGRFFFEKREEHTLGRPKAKSAQGVLAADDLQHLKTILDDEELKKITTPKALELPADAQVLKEAERLDVQVGRGEGLQQFSLMKERVKTGTTRAVSSSAALSGMDTFLDNGAQYRKTLAPILKWFDELGKKNKLTDSKPQYCQATSGG